MSLQKFPENEKVLSSRAPAFVYTALRIAHTLPIVADSNSLALLRLLLGGSFKHSLVVLRPLIGMIVGSLERLVFIFYTMALYTLVTYYNIIPWHTISARVTHPDTQFAYTDSPLY